MAVNKSPWIKNLEGAKEPLIFLGKVQAGSTQAIKRGEICVFNETSGYFVPADAIADAAYSLAIAEEEQPDPAHVVADAARYMRFYALRKGDVFEFALAAASAVAYGTALELTASNSQQLTVNADGVAVAVSVGDDNYPQAGTTLLSKSYVQAVFLPQFSYFYKNVMQENVKKVMAKTAAYTITLEDNGAIITNKGSNGSVTLTAPEGTVPVGFSFKMAVMADQPFVFDPKPDTASVYIKGAAHTAGNTISMTDIGDFAELVWDGTDWLAVNSISGANGDVTLT